MKVNGTRRDSNATNFGVQEIEVSSNVKVNAIQNSGMMGNTQILMERVFTYDKGGTMVRRP